MQLRPSARAYIHSWGQRQVSAGSQVCSNLKHVDWNMLHGPHECHVYLTFPRNTSMMQGVVGTCQKIRHASLARLHGGTSSSNRSRTYLRPRNHGNMHHLWRTIRQLDAEFFILFLLLTKFRHIQVTFWRSPCPSTIFLYSSFSST